jgi:hypothetical protein
MTRDEALQAMKYGCKVTHNYFTDEEFIYMKDRNIFSEEGYDFGGIYDEFWYEKSKNEGFVDGWEIYFKPKDQYETTAVLNGDHYRHFGIQPITANLYGDKPEDIETIKFKIHEDQSLPEKNNITNMTQQCLVDYWGWYDYKDDDFTMMIYPQRFLLNMCFPSGINGSEEVHHGKAFRLEIILL